MPSFTYNFLEAYLFCCGSVEAVLAIFQEIHVFVLLHSLQPETFFIIQENPSVLAELYNLFKESWRSLKCGLSRQDIYIYKYYIYIVIYILYIIYIVILYIQQYIYKYMMIFKIRQKFRACLKFICNVNISEDSKIDPNYSSSRMFRVGFGGGCGPTIHRRSLAVIQA